MNQRQLVFPHDLWQRCQRQLFSPDGAENFLMALARPCPRTDHVAYVVEHVVDGGRQDGYLSRSHHGLTLSDKASSELNILSIKAAKVGLVPVHLHSHPTGASRFSSYDDHHERDLHSWLVGHGQPLLWSLVCAYGSGPYARLWLNGGIHPGVVRAGLAILSDTSFSPLPALDRQRVFGFGLAASARSLRVGIVGVGGIGFPVAEQLARCGFQDFLLVDPDTVEVTNLNRLPGTIRSDIGRPKVRVARRLIRQAGRAIGTRPIVHTLRRDIYTATNDVRSPLRKCDLVLALTDNELSRITCLELALEGGCEYLQAGVDIRLDSGGGVIGLFAEVTGAEVNRYCPLCTGRLDSGQASIDARRYVGGEVWRHAQSNGYVPDVPAPAVMSLNSIAAGMLVMEVQRRVSGLGVRDLLQADFQEGTVLAYEHIENQLRGNCAVCGRQELNQRAYPELTLASKGASA